MCYTEDIVIKELLILEVLIKTSADSDNLVAFIIFFSEKIKLDISRLVCRTPHKKQCPFYGTLGILLNVAACSGI